MRDLRPVSVGTEERRRSAAALIRHGVAVIPVPAGEKNPGRPGWEALRITEDEIPNYWTNGQNITGDWSSAHSTSFGKHSSAEILWLVS
jgi:hypothetical protein